jgi:hypothetical protein
MARTGASILHKGARGIARTTPGVHATGSCCQHLQLRIAGVESKPVQVLG